MRRSLLLFLSVVIYFFQEAEGNSLYWNKGRGYDDFRYANEEGISIRNITDTLQYDYYQLPESSNELTLKFRVKSFNSHPAKKYPFYSSEGDAKYISNPSWGVFVTMEKDTLIFSFQGGEKESPIEPLQCIICEGYSLLSGLKTEKYITENINPYQGDNLWSVKIDDTKAVLYGGRSSFNKINEMSVTSGATGFGFFAGWGADILISDISCEFSESASTDVEASFHVDQLNEYLSKSEDDVEGYYTLFDRELEESLLKLGGFYTLACVKEGEEYRFLYIDGAGVNSKKWNSGDIKIRMIPTPFTGIYDIVWIDAMKQPMSSSIKAQRGEGDTLLIQFPYQSSKLRLRKLTNEPPRRHLR